MLKKILSSAVLLACAAVHAQGLGGKKAYAGLGLGPTSFKVDCASYNPCDRNDSGFKGYVGLTLTPEVSVEAAYMDFGKGAAGSGASRVNFGGNAFVFNGAFRYAFVPEFGAVLRLGLSNAQTEIEVRATGYDESERSWKPYWGFGLEYQVAPRIKAVLAADFVRGESANGASVKAELYTLSGQLDF